MSSIIKRAQNNRFVLIAEIGVNYYDIARENGISLMDAAKLMVKEAREAGIHAVKFQTYKAGTLAAKNSPSYWDTTEEATTSQYELFTKFDSFGPEEYAELKAYSDGLGIEFFSTPFDFAAADYLFPLMDVYKISSSDLNNLPFIAHQAKKNKPVLLSVGASNKEEIDEAVAVIRQENDKPLVLLHCVLEYPTPYEDANLLKIASLKQAYPDCIIGYSDHTKPTPDAEVITTAYNLGAVVVEKHFTLNKNLPGNDHYHAMDPADARRILERVAFVEKLRGSADIVCLQEELTARKNARRSLVSNAFLPAGSTVAPAMLTFKRPGTGIPPTRMPDIIGKRVKADIAEDTILQYDMFE